MTIIIIVATGLVLGSIQRADSRKGWSYALMAFTLVIAIKSIPASPEWSAYEWSVAGGTVAAFALVYYMVDRVAARMQPA